MRYKHQSLLWNPVTLGDSDPTEALPEPDALQRLA